MEDLCKKIHRAMIKNFKNANVWGALVKHRPQKVSYTQIGRTVIRGALEAATNHVMFINHKSFFHRCEMESSHEVEAP